MKLTGALEKESDAPAPIVLPQLPKPDEVDGMMTTLGGYMRRFPSDDRLEVYTDMLGIVSKKRKELKLA